MGMYILKRILFIIPVIFIVTIIIFSLIHAVPGDPIKIVYGYHLSEEDIEIARAKLNLDKPVIVQYGIWLKNLFKGNLGESLRSGEEVGPIIIRRLGVTAILAFASLLISVIISIVLGVIAAIRRNTLVDFSVMIIALFGISVPIFWMGLMVILLFSIYWGVLPSIGYKSFLEC